MSLFILDVFLFGNIYAALSTSARIKFHQHLPSNRAKSLVKKIVSDLSASEPAEVKAIKLVHVQVART